MFYYIVFLFLAFFALNETRINEREKISFGMFLFGMFLVVFIGLRAGVGGDWGNYLKYFRDFLPYMTLDDCIKHTDPGYWVSAYFMNEWGFGLYGENVLIAVIVITGLYKLLKKQPYPWLGLLVAFPYLIIVVSMGYARQAAAIGFVMWALSYLEERKFLKFLFFIFLAVIFHKTAIIMVGIGILASEGRGKFLKFLAGILIAIGLYFAFVAKYEQSLVQNYIMANMQSGGALIRVFMNVIPAIILIKYRKKWQEKFEDYKLWFYISIGAILAVFFVKFASTVVDRLSLYFIPLQIVVFSRLPILVEKNKSIIKLLIIFYYFSVMFVWLNFGNFSYWWQPYKNLLWSGVF